jgi:hypothetical protein
MMRRLDEARDAIQGLRDRDERAFLNVALKTAWIDIQAGTRDGDFDYLIFVEVMRALYKKKALLKDVLDGQADKHRWWPEDE